MDHESRRDQSRLILRQHLTTGFLNIAQTFSGLWSSLDKNRPRYCSDASPQDHVCMPLSVPIIIIIIIIIIISKLSNDRSKASSKTIFLHSAI